MATAQRYFELVSMEYAAAALTVRLTELLEGDPDGYIGRPLVRRPNSRTFTVRFTNVTEFRSRAEPCYVLEGTRRIVTDYLCECVGSDYIHQVCPFGRGAKEPARHFVVFTEQVVIEALSSNEPTVEVTDVA